MIRFMHFPKCSMKRVTSYMICIVIVGFIIHMWLLKDILQFADSITSFFSFQSRLNQFSNTNYKELKYVLLWKRYYLIITDKGESIFSSLDCPFHNCVFSADKDLLGDYSLYDAIVFDDELMGKDIKPAKRTSSQLYIFTTIESSYTQPICEVASDGFFNWTFTYRLDSDVPWLYFVVKNLSGSIVAPSQTVEWQTSLELVNPKIKAILERKKRTAAWLVSHCKTDSFRDEYLSRLQEHLYHYDLTIDVYGRCSDRHCPNYDCGAMIRNDYKFYMAFENSFAGDYVTEKVLHAYDNYAVPIVYGGANYSRFLPPGSYINAREVHPYNLAFIIHEAVESPQIFENYFKWTNLYTVSGDAKDYHPLCHLCEALHSDKAKSAPAKQDFRIWWNGQNGMKWCLPQDYWNETSKVNIDANHLFKVY